MVEQIRPRCPRCHGLCSYQGNYFCNDVDGCGWALPADEPETLLTPTEQRWFAQAYLSLMEQRAKALT